MKEKFKKYFGPTKFKRRYCGVIYCTDSSVAFVFGDLHCEFADTEYQRVFLSRKAWKKGQAV